MIYSQTLISYIFSFIFTLMLLVRMKDYLVLYFEKSYAWLIACTVILHPFSIEVLLAPNPLSGSLAFLLFFEAQFYFLNEKYTKGILALFFAAILNINFFLFPVFYFFKYRTKLKKLFYPIVTYFILATMYAYQHTLDLWKNPIKFIPHFVQNIVLPSDLTIFDYSLFPIDKYSLIFSISLLFYFVWKQERTNKKSRILWPLFIFPTFGILLNQWAYRYHFWDEIIFTPSNFMCITFFVLTMMAFYFPRKLFLVSSIISFAASVRWVFLWFPMSTFLLRNIVALPPEFPEIVRAKRTLAWEYIYEGKLDEGEYILKGLFDEDNKREFAKKDLDIFYQTHPERKGK